MTARPMSRYRRAWIEGGTFFFTITRADRSCDLLVRHIERERGLWQRRYWEHAIRDDADFERHVDYIHFNPVKHGVVTRIKEWPYSSFKQYVERGDRPADWGGDTGNLTGLYGE